MNNKARDLNWIHSWNVDLTKRQRVYLLKRYGSFGKALAVYSKAKRSGMVDFEILKN